MPKKPKNKKNSKLQDDRFFEMAAASYAENLFQEFISQPKIFLTSEENEACDRIWERIERGMPAALAQGRWQRLLPVFRRMGRIAAAIILALTVTFSTAFITVGAFRTRVLNLVYKQHIRYSEIDVTVDGPLSEYFYRPTAIPAGYKMLEEKKLFPLYVAVYMDGEGRYIVFSQNPLSGGGNYNTENGTIETVQVEGQEYILIEVPGERCIIWHNDEAQFNLWSRVAETATTGRNTEGPLSLEEMADIANSTEIFEKACDLSQTF